MVLYIIALTMFSFLPYGGLLRTSTDAGSVARARDANVSMIRLTQSIWIVLSGEYLRITAPSTDMNSATILTVS